MAKIEIEIEANSEQQVLDFEQDSITIGRGLGNDILIEDPQVSRYHARLVFEDGVLILYDLRSRNGTKVNSEKISSCPIRGNESILIGEAIIRARVNARDSQVESSDGKEALRPTGQHRVSGIIEVDQGGQPYETSIFEAEKSTVDFEGPPQIAPIDSMDAFGENEIEKDTEAALTEEPINPADPWRPFENCLSGIMPLINDPTVESVTVRSTESALVKKSGQLQEVAINLTEGQLQEALRIVSTSVKPSQSSQISAPAFSIRLADGSELSGAGPALAPPNGVLVISTRSQQQKKATDFIKEKVLNQDIFYFLHGCVALRKTILVSSLAKQESQNLLAVLAECIPANQRVTLLQGYSKIQLPQSQVIRFAEYMGISAAVLEAASRTRPDRFVIGEMLQKDAVRAFVEQVLGGAQGSLAQIKSPSPEAAIAKLESAICQSDGRIPYEAARTLIRESVQVVVQLYQLPNGAFRVRSISEVVQDEQGHSKSRAVFSLVENESALSSPQYKTTAPTFLGELELTGFEEAYKVFKE